MTESARTGAMLQSEWDSKITTAQLADFLNMTVKSVAVSQSIFDNKHIQGPFRKQDSTQMLKQNVTLVIVEQFFHS